MKQEYAKGYEKPMFPLKLWTTIFIKYGLAQRIQFQRELGIFDKKGPLSFGLHGCEDLAVFREKIENFRAKNNATAWGQKRNKYFDDMDRKYISKYF